MTELSSKYRAILDKVPDLPPAPYDALPIGNLGICGAHRTGKTTLAKELAKTLNIPFVPINTSEVFLQYGFHPSQSFDICTRLFLQQKILEKAENIWFEVDEPNFICDRTPLDMAAYLLADVGNGELDQHTQDEIMSYCGQCFRITKKHFSKLVLIPPAIPFIPSDYKAANNEPLIFGLHYTISGMLSALGLPWQQVPNECLEIGDRVEFVAEYWSQN